MSLFSILEAIAAGGSKRRFTDEDDAPPSSSPALVASIIEPRPACNCCGRTFHPTWINHTCPACHSGRIYG